MNDTQSQTESLLDIVKTIESRSVMLPEFQRDFRWELEQSYDLFDSLIRDIFIGTIIYGKPSFGMTLREIDTRPRKGKESNAPLNIVSYTKSEIVQRSQTQNLRIVLDGQQRITSIYRAIKGIDPIYIILRRELLTLNADEISGLSLESMMQDIAGEESSSAISVKLFDAYITEKHMLEDDVLMQYFMKTSFAQKYFKTADEYQQKIAIKLYRLAIYRLISLYRQEKMVAFYLLDMSLSKFCTFFERSNSKGIQLNFTDILAAKLYYGFNLRKKIDEFESQSDFKLNREIIVRAIAYLVGISRRIPISIDRGFILENLEAHDFTEYWDEICKLYTQSLRYLINQHYILSQAWMPSENMVIPIMMFLRQIKSFNQMTEEQRQFFEFWYWSAIFSNRYSSASNEAIIMDTVALSQVASGETITARNYFIRLRSLITEPDDLYSFTKKSSIIYRGILNLLGYASQGLKDWTNTQKIDMSMSLEDHHIYPRAYIASAPGFDVSQNEAEELVDCVVNRTLIPKITNIKIGKKAPSVYLYELQEKNPKLSECLVSHLIPDDLVIDKDWDSLFKFFLEDRAQKIFEMIESYTIDRAAQMLDLYGIPSEESESIKVEARPRVKDMIISGKIKLGERVYTQKRPDQFATIVDGETVEYEGERLSINAWGKKMTGWSYISIYNGVFLERTKKPLGYLRESE